MIGWDPLVNVEVVKVATPAALIVPTPRTVVPSRNVTEPVAPAWVVARKVTAWPGLDGFTEDANVMLMAALATVTVVGGDVITPVVKVLIAVTVIWFVPTGNEGTTRVAWPLMIVAVPRRVVPSKKETAPDLPVGRSAAKVTA